MKLSAAALFAVTTATCPSGWTDGVSAGTCVPVGVSIVCSETTMSVEFSLNHVYEEGLTELDATQMAAALAHVDGSASADCQDFLYDAASDTFTATYDIDTCTTADHDIANGYLTFTNSFVGDETALLRDGIITTKVLSFEAQCKFADSATVTVDGITVDPGSNIAETVSDVGMYSFSIGSYIDSAFSTAADSSNMVEIGDKIYTKVWTDDSLPAAVEYHVTDCIAWETYDSSTSTGSGGSYTLFDTNTCVSDLVETDVIDYDGTDSTDAVEFSFNSFTFDTSQDTVALVCNVKLCLVTETSCFVQAVTGDCATGYTPQ